MLAAIPDPLRVLIALGLTMLLVLLRLEAERFRAAEYAEPDETGQASVLKRLTWYAVGAALVVGVLLFHPAPALDLYLGPGTRVPTVLLGLLYALGAAVQAVVYSRYRYGRVRLPDVGDYPSALLNQIATAFVDEAAFRGALLGFIVLVGVPPPVAILIQACVYSLATRLGAPGRDPYLFGMSLAAGLIGGWVTVVTGGFAAAFLGHAVMRISFFLVTGHAGHPAPRGSEEEEIERRRRPPEGWRVIPTRGQSRER
jgi:hypothetical protein